MQQQLPNFEGERIDFATMHLYGSPENPPQVAYRREQSVYAVVRLRVSAVEHGAVKEVPVRKHKAAVEELYEVDEGVFIAAGLAARRDSGQPTLLDGEGDTAEQARAEAAEDYR